MITQWGLEVNMHALLITVAVINPAELISPVFPPNIIIYLLMLGFIHGGGCASPTGHSPGS